MLPTAVGNKCCQQMLAVCTGLYDYPDCAASHRVETWLAFLDIVVNEINARFSQECFKPVADAENVLLRAAKGMSVTDELQRLSNFYDNFNYEILAAQLLLLRNLFSASASSPSTVTDISQALNSNEGVNILLPEVVRLLKLSLVVPATSASAERSFSALQRLHKTA